MKYSNVYHPPIEEEDEQEDGPKYSQVQSGQPSPPETGREKQFPVHGRYSSTGGLLTPHLSLNGHEMDDMSRASTEVSRIYGDEDISRAEGEFGP